MLDWLLLELGAGGINYGVNPIPLYPQLSMSNTIWPIESATAWIKKLISFHTSILPLKERIGMRELWFAIAKQKNHPLLYTL